MVKVNSGLSKVDRITFYDSKIGATAIRLPNGKIEIRYEKKNVTMYAVLVILGLFSIISLLKSFIIMPYITNHTTMLYVYFAPTAFYVFLLVASIKEMRSDGDNLLRNHGAEHMVFRAYKKLKRIPTISEVKNFSRINSQCGINIYSSFIMAQIIGFFVYRYAGYIIPEVWLVVVPVCFNCIFPFNLIGNIAQFWTTSKPKDENIILAIVAMIALEYGSLHGEVIESIDNSKN